MELSMRMTIGMDAHERSTEEGGHLPVDPLVWLLYHSNLQTIPYRSISDSSRSFVMTVLAYQFQAATRIRTTRDVTFLNRAGC